MAKGIISRIKLHYKLTQTTAASALTAAADSALIAAADLPIADAEFLN